MEKRFETVNEQISHFESVLEFYKTDYREDHIAIEGIKRTLNNLYVERDKLKSLKLD